MYTLLLLKVPWSSIEHAIKKICYQSIQICIGVCVCECVYDIIYTVYDINNQISYSIRTHASVQLAVIYKAMAYYECD